MAPKNDEGASAPLITEENVAVCLEQGLSDEHDFQSIISARPKRVVQWLQEDGIEKLGEFEIQVACWATFHCQKHI